MSILSIFQSHQLLSPEIVPRDLVPSWVGKSVQMLGSEAGRFRMTQRAMIFSIESKAGLAWTLAALKVRELCRRNGKWPVRSHWCCSWMTLRSWELLLHRRCLRYRGWALLTVSVFLSKAYMKLNCEPCGPGLMREVWQADFYRFLVENPCSCSKNPEETQLRNIATRFFRLDLRLCLGSCRDGVGWHGNFQGSESCRFAADSVQLASLWSWKPYALDLKCPKQWHPMTTRGDWKQSRSLSKGLQLPGAMSVVTVVQM